MRIEGFDVGLEMHPTAVSRTLCTYYLDTQVEER